VPVIVPHCRTSNALRIASRMDCKVSVRNRVPSSRRAVHRMPEAFMSAGNMTMFR
jgi:hypothetical protein